MSNSTSNLQRRILHIRADSPDRTNHMAALLESLSAEVDVCGDVYRAVARLCTQTPAATQAVIVCVDDLAPVELELFPLLKRVRRDLRVYVYGDCADTDRVVTAIELGADGRATEEIVRAMVERVGREEETRFDLPASTKPLTSDTVELPSQACDESAASQTHLSIAYEDDRAACDDATGAREDGDYVDTADETAAQAKSDEELRGPARVPWLRNNDGPARIAPSRMAAPLGKQRDEPSGVSDNRSDRPLLTEAELRALIDDELPPIVPSDAGDADHDDHFGSGSDV
ncbi:MAG: hypothetical protein IIB60_04395 [Planctomycetes bacterium]|nr:hypothetical protein [Planctomycetota bacterium]